VALDPSGSRATVRKEFPGGRLAVFEVPLPAVLGIQSAEQPPRYVPVSKVTQAKRALQPKELAGPGPAVAAVTVRRLRKPEPTARAEMVPGDAGQVADWIVRLLRERGLV
jgi:electron transfer flavoprotein beta subunit